MKKVLETVLFLWSCTVVCVLQAAPCYINTLKTFLTQPYWEGSVQRDGNVIKLTGGGTYCKVMSNSMYRPGGFKDAKFTLSADVRGKGEFRMGFFAYVTVDGKLQVRQFFTPYTPIGESNTHIEFPVEFAGEAYGELRTVLEVRGSGAWAEVSNLAIDDPSGRSPAEERDERILRFRSGRLEFGINRGAGSTLCGVKFDGEMCDNNDLKSLYGAVVRIYGAGGFVGSGHRETGFEEEVLQFDVLLDGVSADWEKGGVMTGETIVIRKRSKLRNFTLECEIIVKDDRLTERYAISSEVECRLESIYIAMHPWNIRFTEMLSVDGAGYQHEFKFVGNSKMAFSEFRPVVALHNPQSGLTVVSGVFPQRGQSRSKRLLWDTERYRKDYQMDYEYGTFPAGARAEYLVHTVFFRQNDPARWKSEALERAAGLKDIL